MHKPLFLFFLFFLALGNSFSQEEEITNDIDPDSEVSHELTPEQKIEGSLAKVDQLVHQVLQMYQSLSEEQVQEQVKSQIGSLPIGPYFADKPRFYLFVTRILRDETALPKFFSILKEKQRLLIFLGINIGIFIFGYLWKKNQKSQYARSPFLLRTFKAIKRIISVKIIQLGFFTFYFFEEIKPFAIIFKKTFL